MGTILGVGGGVTLTGASTNEADLISKTTSTDWSLTVNGDALNTTSFVTAGPETYTGGLYDWSFSFNGYTTTAIVGAAGSISVTNGYDHNIRDWTLAISTTALEETGFDNVDASTNKCRFYKPGLYNATVGYNGYVDGDDAANPIVLPGSRGAISLAIDGSNSFTATAGVSTGPAITSTPGALGGYANNLQISGALTAIGSTNFLTAGALSGLFSSVAAATLTGGVSTDDGTEDLTLSGDAFLTSLVITCPVDGLVSFAANCRGTGPLAVSSA